MIKIKTMVLAIFLLFLINAYSTASAQLAITSADKVSSHFINANGIRIHYIEAGKGPLVVLLHGWPETSYSWRFTMYALSDHYRVVAPDLRGIGLSERTVNGYDKKTIATDIKDLIAALGETQAVIIGHDMGGKTAYIMAHLYPNYISKLVLVDCLIPGTENTDALHGGAWHYGFHMAPEFPEMLTKGREKEYIQAQIKAWSFKKNAISEEALNEYARHYATDGGMTAGFNYYRALPQDAALAKSFQEKKLTMPVLAISGAYGVADKLPLALVNHTTSLQTVIVKDSGHFVAEEDPEKFNAIIKGFLAKN
jgi:pimeloyl-ACP methyl ester carboxylesterase